MPGGDGRGPVGGIGRGMGPGGGRRDGSGRGKPAFRNRRINMPATTQKQARFFRAELGRKRVGEKTRTGLSESKIKEFTKVRGLGEAVENITGNIPLEREVQISASTTDKKGNMAIKSPTY